mmetsp:Transcript_17257/g.38196  ORF Transcript_17257/g.38196 Transcript_17257/m.38196 type:complete len:228 (+) Transcript_17257:248-931(+)
MMLSCKHQSLAWQAGAPSDQSKSESSSLDAGWKPFRTLPLGPSMRSSFSTASTFGTTVPLAMSCSSRRHVSKSSTPPNPSNPTTRSTVLPLRKHTRHGSILMSSLTVKKGASGALILMNLVSKCLRASSTRCLSMILQRSKSRWKKWHTTASVLVTTSRKSASVTSVSCPCPLRCICTRFSCSDLSCSMRSSCNFCSSSSSFISSPMLYTGAELPAFASASAASISF